MKDHLVNYIFVFLIRTWSRSDTSQLVLCQMEERELELKLLTINLESPNIKTLVHILKGGIGGGICSHSFIFETFLKNWQGWTKSQDEIQKDLRPLYLILIYVECQTWKCFYNILIKSKLFLHVYQVELILAEGKGHTSLLRESHGRIDFWKT